MKKVTSYTAFYVKEPFVESNLGARAAHDFCYYNILRLWAVIDPNFPFKDAHDMTYNVRDDSQWETLKARLHERLRQSQNIILILSKDTKNSRALREEIDYGVNVLGLPIIFVYINVDEETMVKDGALNVDVLSEYWRKLPILDGVMDKVPSFHVPMRKGYIASAIIDPDVCVNTKKEVVCYFYNKTR